MNYKFRLLSLIAIDSIIVLLSIYLSHIFLNPFSPHIDFMVVASSIVLVLSHHFLSSYYHLYKNVWKYANVDEIVDLCKVVFISIVLTAAIQVIFFQDLYERALFLTLILHIVLLCGVRLAWRYLQLGRDRKIGDEQPNAKRTLILGAGKTGRNIAGQLLLSSDKLKPVVFLDDNPNLKNLEICGVPVVGSLREIENVVDHYRIRHIIIAITNLKNDELTELVRTCKKVCHDVQIMPSIGEVAAGNLTFSKIRDVSIEDLLGRTPIRLDDTAIKQKITNKKVLVTGAGGSIGSELCRQIIKHNPKTLILLDHSEFSIFRIMNELKENYPKVCLKTEILSVENSQRVELAMQEHQPSLIFHAAAYKHVPLMEENIYSAVATNVLGTKNVIDAAHHAGVESFVLISTDKAVNPSNVMGATKRIAELIVNAKNLTSQTKYSIVRFGNVLGSSGSVVPIFKEQIQKGGPVTVTHPEMTRFFMTIPEASQLVLQAASLSEGGETFILDMGTAVKISDLAKQLIKLSGFSEEEIQISYVGIRKGEKLHEELFYENEEQYTKVHEKINAFVNEKYIMDIERVFANYLQLQETELEVKLWTTLAQSENASDPRKVINK